MQHIAIMKKSWGLLPKILTGEKTIESRWYMNKCRPWDRIQSGDIVYFKNSGEPVTVKAVVTKILQFDNLDPDKVGEILKKYGKADGLGIQPSEFDKYLKMFNDKKYCILVLLKDAKKIKPFDINKTGFGAMSAWITVNNINEVKKYGK